MDTRDLRFPGRYELLPARCTDPAGPVPVRGTCVLEPRGELVRIFVAWRTPDGVERWATSGGAMDGARHADPQPPQTHVRYAVLDADTLLRESFVDTRVVASAWHRVQADGAELEVVTERVADDGTTERSVYVYARVQD